jgi:hypothetical protein
MPAKVNRTALLIFAALFGMWVLWPNAHQPKNNLQNHAALESALNLWWQAQYDGIPQPEKPGTVTPAHTLKGNPNATLPAFRQDLPIQRHVQTQAEYAEQAKDVEWAAHMRALVTGFRVSGNTVTALTRATRGSTYKWIEGDDQREAQEVCHQMGGFVWANGNRHWGLENIEVLGAGGELLTSRIGMGWNHGHPTGCQ